MAAALSAEARALLDQPNVAHLATLMPDGSPQVTPVWIEVDGPYITFNTAAGRQKERNVRRHSRVAISVTDRENPYKWVAIRGRVAEVTEEGADQQIDRLARKYLGQDRYPFRQPGERRVRVRVEPLKVTVSG